VGFCTKLIDGVLGTTGVHFLSRDYIGYTLNLEPGSVFVWLNLHNIDAYTERIVGDNTRHESPDFSWGTF